MDTHTDTAMDSAIDTEQAILVESYLHEVGRYLPQAQRNEILADLQDAVVEEVTSAAPEEDAREVLRRFGHPFRVAGKYLPQRYVIGPTLYPVFMHILKLALIVAFAGQVLVSLALAQMQGWQIGPFGLLWGTLELLIWVFAVVVAVFVALEFSGEKLNWYEDWTPGARPSGALGVVLPGDVLSNLVTEGFFLLWWNDVVVLDNFLPAGSYELALTAVWTPLYWPLNALMGVAFVLHLLVLLRGVWQRSTQLVEMACNAAVVVLGLYLLTTGPLAAIVSDGEMISSEVTFFLQMIVKAAIFVVIAVTLSDMRLGWRVLIGARAPDAAAPTH